MPLYQVIVLAIVQGLTEFLPISSTAHLHLLSWMLGWNGENLTFDIALHVGTLLAVLLYFFREWVQIIAQAFGIEVGRDTQLRHNRALLWLVVIATIPVALLGVLFQKQAETSLRTPWVIGSMLIAVGVLMWIADSREAGKRDLSAIDIADAGLIGISQALAIIPGVSRSGITITTGLFRGIDRESAARFSFLLSTPAIGGAAAKAIWDVYKQGAIQPEMRTAFLVGVSVSAVTGCIVIAWFLRFLRQRGTLRFFVYYRIIFGIIVLALAFFRA